MSHFTKYDEQHTMDNRFYIFVGFMTGLLTGVIITMVVISTEHRLF